MPTTQEEYAHREGLWRRLLDTGGPTDVDPGLLRELGMYGGPKGYGSIKRAPSRLIPAV